VDDTRYGPVFMRAARYIARVYNRHLANVSLTASQHVILEAIGQSGPVALQDLTDKLVIERSALQRTIQPLIRGRFIESVVDRFDKRRLLYQLTDDGHRLLESAVAYICSAEVELEELFDRSDILTACGNQSPAAIEFREKADSIG
jgi:DNA-binding MarR family transcriptional regulator